MQEGSIFRQYYSNPQFYDRYEAEDLDGVDVIIPVINTNELWERNLLTFYREIPINRLLIGDGGCTDDTIDIVEEFPRVTVFDQTEYETQGYCIKELIEQVETDWFVYLHADVFLPDGWFDEMATHRDDLDWFECFRRHTVLVEYENENQNEAGRALSGSQMGRTEAFDGKLDEIDDDYLQRNEDIVFSELIDRDGSYGRVADTFHYHQVMEREDPQSSFGEDEPQVTQVTIDKERAPEWERKVAEMQAKGIIKYTSPKPYLVNIVGGAIYELMQLDAFDEAEFKTWVENEDPEWAAALSYKKLKLRDHLATYAQRVKNTLKSAL